MILEQVTPILTIAKENMLTNCLKNEELFHAREDIADMATKIGTFQAEIAQIADFESKLLRLGDSFAKELRKL